MIAYYYDKVSQHLSADVFLCTQYFRHIYNLLCSYFLQKSKKRKADKLVSAETMDAGQLRNAAMLREDVDILLDIQGKDCVALEVN